MNRPRLKNHAQPLRRGPGSIQLGLCPDRGVVLDGLSNPEIAVMESLDGSMDIQTLYAVAAAAGVAYDRVCELMDTLQQHRLLVDLSTDRAWSSPIDQPLGHPLPHPLGHPRRPGATAAAAAIVAAYSLTGDGFDHLTARSTQHVAISGDGDLPRALADLLRAGGIGEVSVGTNAVDALDLELRGHRTAGRRAMFGTPLDRPAHPDLVVLAAMGAIPADAGEPWLRRGIPHLPLVVQAHRVQVGPLIAASPLQGGRSGPCLSCMDLHRRDKDAAWPALLSQLTPTWPLHPGPEVSLESTLTAMTVGIAAMIVHTCLDGQPVPGDLSLELSLPWPAVVTRRWFRHPLCGCTPGQGTMAG
ncbi:MAG: hypothetical protein QOE58_1798 [Actinomycetota bacterium]|jgi:hypothetical protein|nr:hypothetical protein [Actinomycetota bacterium]